ncbi:hypothetical protein O979_01765 [Mycobacterium avium subsp. paratuberculosis 10-4404]|nr:hypothetical protein O979_01765 [Mycobacterium avium subsp. paratuberculosis 10-4404]ETB07931.1 hypothetical protein O978_01880 [Mycobacterium avium subsp. paratuberculosis 10-5864]ETB14689.1 hypothetical protein O980_01915 [Mycobacterium avium subsp. paratuberculosis 08-8281]ETB36147.1 hypothetical protein O977_01965 [Mycobacterium avium subsp. paratuberculosis 10-5975]ETB44394.1 hypothetical protein O975_02070 [Mycobacterium avium subsp. paratuberculosis 11-1786]ETB54687.1 hypothetical pr
MTPAVADDATWSRRAKTSTYRRGMSTSVLIFAFTSRV